MKNILTRLSIETGMRETLLERIIRTAPVRYKEFTIPKRNGEPRPVAQPAREVKMVQRALSRLLLNKLPIHHAATAYRTGISIADNADRHSGFGSILKLDFENFFPSITISDWRQYCRRTGCVETDEEIELTGSLLFKKYRQYRGLRLAIGAPSSPILSNILMHDFDRKMTDFSNSEHVTFSRYADDLTFSAARTGYLTGITRQVRQVLAEMDGPILRINAQKTVYATTKFRREVTGLILSNDGRVTIGKAKKRLLHAAVHRTTTGHVTPPQMAWLCGMLAYVNSVEPEFIQTLKRRYGQHAIDRIQGQTVRLIGERRQR